MNTRQCLRLLLGLVLLLHRREAPDVVLYTGRRGAQPGVKRPTTHSAFELLYMILYIGGGHTAGCAVLAFVPFQ